MSFPTTGILDDFNRADEGPPPGAGWANTGWSPSGLVVESNECVPDNLGIENGAYWNALYIDFEFYFTLTELHSVGTSIEAKFRADLVTGNGFTLRLSRQLGDDEIILDDDVSPVTYLVADFQAGDSFGISASGTSISVFYRPVGGSWSQVIYVVSDSYIAGYIFLYLQDGAIDNFGGGSIATPELSSPTEPAMVFSQCGPEPILRVSDGTEIIDLLARDSGWELEDPYWNPQIAQYKGGGSYVNAGLAEGQRLVHKEYDNVIETIPLSAHGFNQNRAIQTVRRLLQLGRQASDYWTKSYEYDDVWLEAKPAGNDCLTGYARIVKMSIPELTNPFGQPFFSSFNEAIMNGITLTIEREPLWRGVPPGEIIGTLYNLLKNPDFELWNFGTTDSQPDSWTDLETIQITGQNSRESTSPHSGLYSLKIRVSGSTLAGRMKGVTQAIENIKDNTEYTVVAWVRSEGVSNGVGRILITYSSQLEIYRSSDRHGWTLYTGKFTTGIGDSVAVNLEILTTVSNTDGTIYIDSLMLLEGDWETEAANGTLPYLSGSHIVNHWDQTGGTIVAGDINWVDVWNVPGDEDALVRLEFLNNTTVANEQDVIENVATLRIGQRRTKNVLNFQNYNDPPGITDANSSSADYVNVASLTAAWQDITTNLLTGSIDTGDNQGRFRVLARVYDAKAGGSPTMQARLKYFFGTAGTNDKILPAVDIPIRANWAMVELTPTAALIREYKHQPDPPGQLGYTIQLSRTSGSDAGRLDYTLLLPTDGGILTATINPPIEPKTAFVIDGTNMVIQASAIGIKTGFRTVWDSNVSGTAGSIINFKGYTYASALSLFGANGRLFRKPSGQISEWLQVATFTDSILPNSFAIYGDRLFLGTGTGTARVWGSVDGIAWSNVYNPTIQFGVYGMKAFDGYLWTGGNLAAGRWDGTTYTQSINFGAGATGVILEVYSSKLFAIVQGLNTLYVREPGTDTWTSLGTIAAPYCATVFNGELYIGCDRYIQAYNGSSVVTKHDFGASYGMTAMAVLSGKLYAAGRIAPGTTTEIYVTEDGTTWEKIYDTEAISTANIYAMIGTQGNLDLVGAEARVEIVTIVLDKPVQYSISEFQGGSFTSPPEKRHRYVFSYDRANYINNVSDRALIGLGFVPRYLSLRGAN